MEYLHAQTPPIVHRDLKSHNLLIDAKWRVKLCDFGLVTTKYVTAGTPQYLAPELIEVSNLSGHTLCVTFATPLHPVCRHGRTPAKWMCMRLAF